MKRSAPPSRGLVAWFTGLSGAGKSTLCSSVAALLEMKNLETETLDADLVRKHISGDLGFTREDRDENVHRIGFVAQLLARHGVIVLVAAMSPFREARAEVREMTSDPFLEIYVNAPVAVCESRDVKGLYKKARQGLLKNVVGIDVAYEPPRAADLEVHTDLETIEESTARIVAKIEGVICSA